MIIDSIPDKEQQNALPPNFGPNLEYGRNWKISIKNIEEILKSKSNIKSL